MEIKEYTKFRTDEILPLYTQVGWTAYTEDMAALEWAASHGEVPR